MNEATIKELEQLQNEKRKMLLEHETLKMKQREEAFSQELKEWRAQLKPRKQVMLSFSVYILLVALTARITRCTLLTCRR